jgi:hypothetical protein
MTCDKGRKMKVIATIVVLTIWAIRSSDLLAAPVADPPETPATAADAPAAAPAAELPLAQEQVLRKYQRFEEVLLRMSELTAATDPKRAALLRKAVGQSKDKLIGVQFDQLVDLLKREQLAKAVSNQQDVQKDLKQLLVLLLSEQRGDRLKNERQRIKEQIRRLNELINKQQQLEGQTQGGADPKKLGESQGKLGKETGTLADEMKDPAETDPKSNEDEEKGSGEEKEQGKDENDQEGNEKPTDKSSDKEGSGDGEKDKSPKDKPANEKGAPPQESPPGESEKPDGEKSDGKKADGKPSEGRQKSPGQPSGEKPDGEQSQADDQPPPSDSQAARQRVREAQKAMDDARKKLDEAKREGAAEDQEQARRKLEEAKAKLEEVLRQLREEEVERSLALLEARFRKMLQMQTEVYEGTVRVDRVKPEDRTHNEEIEAGRLSRRQRSILDELNGAETLLREDGTSVAFPEAVDELREDMEQVASRLAEAKVDQITQLTEQDIIAALEEMIAAFQKAQKENEQKKQQQQPQQAGEQQEPPLVDALAELKMIRALQMRVNKRTLNYSKLVEGEEGQAEKAELVEALDKLSQRENRIYRVTRDLVLGKNQ